jgi:hypothetical protein
LPHNSNNNFNKKGKHAVITGYMMLLAAVVTRGYDGQLTMPEVHMPVDG